MTDRVRSDNPSVASIRARVERRGGTRRPEVRLPEDRADALPEGVVRLVVDGREWHAPAAEGAIRGAYANPRCAREREGTDRLAGWIDDRGVGFGRSVVVDVVVPGFRYGVRLPGDGAVYDASEPPAEGLRDIAEDL